MLLVNEKKLFLDIDCGKVPPLLYGTANYTNGTTYLHSEVQYSCVNNYRLNGVNKRICLENGQWSHESPKCEGIFLKIDRIKTNLLIGKPFYIYL